jgi:acetyltransferase-like isoleucine patch superfamily enzyme
MRNVLVLLTGLLPKSSLKNVFLRALGWKIDKGVRIGTSVFWNVRSPKIGKGVTLSSFSVFRNAFIEIMPFSSIGHWNWITSIEPTLPNFHGSGIFRLGQNSAITSRHYIDCSGGFVMGNFSVIAGIRSTFFTHQIDYKENSQQCLPINIGDFVLISSCVNISPGTIIGNGSLVAMGSNLIRTDYQSSSFIAGEPARAKRTIHGKYFVRKIGAVGFLKNHKDLSPDFD